MTCFQHELSWLIKLLCRYGDQVNIFTYQGTCSELPIGGHLRTDAVFPVKEGAEVYVNCVDGYTLVSGDRIITCVQDAHYISPKQLPTCIIGNENISINQITIFFANQWHCAQPWDKLINQPSLIPDRTVLQSLYQYCDSKQQEDPDPHNSQTLRLRDQGSVTS